MSDNLSPEQLLESKKLPCTFCVLPWIHTYISTNKILHPCCQSQVGMARMINNSNLSLETDLNKLFNNREYIKFREKLLSGDSSKVPDTCKQNCFNLEKNGGFSYRQHSNNEFLNLLDLSNIFNTATQKISHLHVGFSNKCNFRCRMCIPMSSNSILSEYKKNVDKYSELQKDINDCASGIGLQEIPLIAIKNGLYKNLEVIQFLGGEPFIQESTWDLLEFLIEKNKTNIKIIFHTNASILNFKGKNILDVLKNFDSKNVKIYCSIDDFGDRAELIRKGTKWEDVRVNLKRLVDSEFETILAITSSVYNVFRLQHIINYFVDQKIINSNYNNFYINPISEPSWLNFSVLNFNLKNNIIFSLEKFISSHPFKDVLQDKLKNVLLALKDKKYSHNIKNSKLFLDKITMFDDMRKENTFDIIPELKQLRFFNFIKPKI